MIDEGKSKSAGYAWAHAVQLYMGVVTVHADDDIRKKRAFRTSSSHSTDPDEEQPGPRRSESPEPAPVLAAPSPATHNYALQTFDLRWDRMLQASP